MSGSPFESANAARRGKSPERSPARRIALSVLALLSAWAIVYELAFTVFPGLLDAFPFHWIAPDVVFLIAAALLIWRGVAGERGWVLIGIGAACWASGDIYWTLHVSKLSNPPTPSWADAGYLSFCPLTFKLNSPVSRSFHAKSRPRGALSEPASGAKT